MRDSSLFAGAGRADITPEVGCFLEGYAPDIVSTSVHDPLDVKALALSDGENKVLLFSLSVCELSQAVAAYLQKELSESTGLPEDRLLLSCIHTHSGPRTNGSEGWGTADWPYCRGILAKGLKAAAAEALSRLAPAEYAIAETESLIGVNRREMKRDGRLKLGQNPWGPQDRRMILVRFRNRETQEGLFQMVYYGCHGTAAGKNHEISRDWMGVMLDRLEAESGVMSGFWNGSVGDVGPRLTNGKTTGTKGDIAYAEELGGRAARDAVKLLRMAEKAPYEQGGLFIFPVKFTLACRPMPERAEVERYLEENPDGASYVNIKKARYSFMCRMKAMLDRGEALPKERTFSSTMLALGDSLVICPTGFELFSETTLMADRFSPFRHSMLLSLTGATCVYLPAPPELCRGGYEVESFLYQAQAPLADSAGYDLAFAAADKMDELYKMTEEQKHDH